MSLFTKPSHGPVYLGWSTGQLVKMVAARGPKVRQSERCVLRKYLWWYDLSTGTQGLQKGLGTEDGASDKEVEGTQSLSWPSLPNGGWGSSFVAGWVSDQPDVLISSQSLYHPPHIWAPAGGSGISLGKRLLTGSVSLHTIPSSRISSSTFFEYTAGAAVSGWMESKESIWIEAARSLSANK